MRILFIFIFSVILLRGAPLLSFNPNLQIPKQLQQQIERYWAARMQKKFDISYRYEIPYQQYIYTKGWYMNFFKDAPLFSSAQVKKLVCKKNHCTVGILLKNGDTKLFLYDRWFYVGDRWYHLFRDRALPF